MSTRNALSLAIGSIACPARKPYASKAASRMAGTTMPPATMSARHGVRSRAAWRLKNAAAASVMTTASISAAAAAIVHHARATDALAGPPAGSSTESGPRTQPADSAKTHAAATQRHALW